MFTGIIEATGIITEISNHNRNKTFVVQSPLSAGLKPDQSLSHNGVCLTVEAISGNTHTVTAIAETLSKTTLGGLKPGQTLNLERCMPADGRFDGHIVQGHTDGTLTCLRIQPDQGSWLFDFSLPSEQAHLVVEKGSVCLNGVSLTAYNVAANSFRVAIIPYTYEHTTFGTLQAGDTVNMEYDIIGKYLLRLHQLRNL